MKKEKAKAFRTGLPAEETPSIPPVTTVEETSEPPESQTFEVTSAAKSIVLTGEIPPELWNKVGIRLIPKLRSVAQPTLGVNFVLELDSVQAANLVREIQQTLADLELTGKIKVDLR